MLTLSRIIANNVEIYYRTKRSIIRPQSERGLHAEPRAQWNGTITLAAIHTDSHDLAHWMTRMLDFSGKNSITR